MPVFQAFPTVCQFSDPVPASLGEDRNGLVLWGRRHDEDHAALDKCGHGVRSCLVAVTMAGANRNLWVKVDTRMTDWVLMGSIGHELQHAIEVLSDRTVTSGVAMYFFYLRKGRPRGQGVAFETDAAIEAGEAVRTEARK